MNVLVLNCGSSSVKFQLIETDSDRIAMRTDIVHLQGLIEKIGTAEAIVSYCFHGAQPQKSTEELLNHHAAISRVVQILEQGVEAAARAGEGGSPAHKLTPEAIGHRVVHGGEHFTESHLIDAEVVRGIERAMPLAPLHNPHNLKGYTVCRDLFPDLPQVAVFDTAFHHTLPPYAFLYGLPYDYYRRQRIRRYGFHGTSVRYVFYRYRELTGAARTTSNLIVCHLGNGCSITAIENGQSVDTSMGFTPLEGVMMGTRSGDLDPSIILHLMTKDELAPHEVATLLNRWSGLYGLSGESNDMRTVINSMTAGDERSKVAVQVFCYRIRKYIGAYWAALGRLDAIIFTGGIGQNAALVRQMVCDRLDALGAQIDEGRNMSLGGREGLVSLANSRIAIWVIPTNEELLIARDTYRVVHGLPLP
jgi:acetate kinase